MNVLNLVVKILLLVQLCWLLIITPVMAVEIADPYIASALVLNQSQQEKSRVVTHELLNVLIRVSGNEKLAENIKIQAALKKAAVYVNEFGYESINQGLNVRDAKYTQRITIQYDEYLINQLLSKNGFSIWGRNRPEVIMWLAIEEGSSQQVIAAADLSSIKQQLLQNSASRGLPIIWPLMDIEDTNNISYIELWGLFRNKIEFASARYNTEAILAGKLYQRADSSWSGHWLFIFDGSAYGFITNTSLQEQGAIQALGVATNQLASHYVVSRKESSNISINFEILNISNVEAYAHCLTYLEKISMVQQVNLVFIHKDRIVVQITSYGDAIQLQEAIALDKKMLLKQQSSDLQNTTYQWLNL